MGEWSSDLHVPLQLQVVIHQAFSNFTLPLGFLQTVLQRTQFLKINTARCCLCFSDPVAKRHLEARRVTTISSCVSFSEWMSTDAGSALISDLTLFSSLRRWFCSWLLYRSALTFLIRKATSCSSFERASWEREKMLKTNVTVTDVGVNNAFHLSGHWWHADESLHLKTFGV